jgi:PAS domain S-box-containing protein
MRLRLMSVLGAISLLIFIFFIVIVYYFIRDTETTAWRGRQQEAALSASGALISFIDQASQSLDYLTRLPPALLTSTPAILQEKIRLHPEFLEIIRLDSDGVVIASAYQERAVLANLFTIPLSQWFLHTRAGARFYGSVQISSTDEPYLVMAVPAPDGGAVAARLHIEILWEVVANMHFGETGQAYVINKDGRIIAHTDRKVVLDNTSVGALPAYSDAAVLEHQWSGAYVNFRGEPVVGVITLIDTTEWSVITELAQREAYATSRIALIVLGSGMLAFMFLLLLVARSFLLRSVLRPMDQLRIGAERIGQGDLDYRINLYRRDEIGTVASAFDEMAQNLHDRERALEVQAAYLESEVTERTQAELSLRESEARYRAIVEDQTELICRFTIDGSLTFVNDAYCRYFNRSRSELLGASFMIFLKEEDRLLATAQLTALTPENPVASIEHQVVLNNGEIRWMHWTDRMLTGSIGDRREFQSVGRDVTERRQIEEEVKRLNLTLERRVEERTEQLVSANRELQSQIAERQRVEATLRESEERLKLALRAANAGVWEWNLHTNDAYWSEDNYRVLGLSPHSVESRYENWLHCVHPEDRLSADQAVAQSIDARTELNIEFRTIWPDGSIHWISDVGRVIFDDAGHPVGMYGIQMDITDRKLATERIRAQLSEKELLLKEIHHRVKNNLQIISSLLNLQSGSINDALTRSKFQDSQNRIRSMALIHERLYRSNDLASIDFAIYLQDLAGSLVQTYRRQAQSVVLKVEAEPLLLDIDTAIPIGLIVNELVSNALKHGFPNERLGQIGIILKHEETGGEHNLTIWDDGVGIPAEVDYPHTGSLGLQLVNSLTRQINARVELCRDTGTRFVIRFSGSHPEGQRSL